MTFQRKFEFIIEGTLDQTDLRVAMDDLHDMLNSKSIKIKIERCEIAEINESSTCSIRQK